LHKEINIAKFGLRQLSLQNISLNEIYCRTGPPLLVERTGGGGALDAGGLGIDGDGHVILMSMKNA
jgi:hypothetical protein